VATAGDVNPVSSTGDVNPVTTGIGGFGGVSPDGPGVGPGVGGFGGTSPVGVGPQQCDCNLFCKDLESCFPISDAQCQNVCAMVPQNFLECTCNAAPNCNAIQNCFNQPTGGGGSEPGTGGGSAIASTGVGTGGGGGGINQACTDCVNNTAMTTCASQFNDCESHQNCNRLIECEDNCGFDPVCVSNCESQFPANVNRARALLECAVCDNCPGPCAMTELFTTACTLPPSP
jgi:hypothetical protein